MKYVLSLLVFGSLAFALSVVEPIGEIKAKGVVKDMVLKDDMLVIGTDSGFLQVYDTKGHKFVKEIKLENIKDFMGDEIPARVFAVDKYEQKYVLLSDSGKGGYTNMWLHENNQTMALLTTKEKLSSIKVRFIDSTHVLLGLLGNEAVLFDIVNKKALYRVQLNESKFSDFALNEQRTQAVFACESGVLNVIDTKTGKVLKVLQGQNVDNVYKVDFKKGFVSAAGQDRRGSIYDLKNGKGTYIQGDFLIYATALSPLALRVAFAMDEENNISIYNVNTKSKIAILKGQKSTLNIILFKDEEHLFSSSDDDSILVWKLNQQGE